MKLSKRMEAIAGLVTLGNVVADVGTDHGYIPIALVKRGSIPGAIAMDLREGPLERAKEHIAMFGLEGQIDTRLSDGVMALAAGEADTIIIAGMGGELVIHILMDGDAVCKKAKELILQPQSEIAQVRAFLREQGYQLLDENMIEEDGKFYPMMRVAYAKEESREVQENQAAEEAREAQEAQEACDKTASKPKEKDTAAVTSTDELQKVEDMYGPILLEKKHPILQQFLQKQSRQLESIADGLKKQKQTQPIVARLHEVEELIWINHKAQQLMA